MFNKKKKNERPDYTQYSKDPDGFKSYLQDMIWFLRSEGNIHALSFDLDGFLKTLPADATPEGLISSDESAPYISELLQNLGWELFGDMLKKSGLTEDTMKMILRSEDFTGLNATGKDIPGLSDPTGGRFDKTKANAIYSAILDKLSTRIIEATSANDPKLLDEPIQNLTSVQERTADMKVSSEARENIQNLLESTIVFQELIDNDRTTPEEYNSFLNNMITGFINDQIEDTNKTVVGKHTDHNSDDCDLTQFHSDGPLKIVYRRLYSAKDDEVPIPGLHLIVLDTARGVVHPIAISLHEALSSITEKRFASDCRSDEGSNFIGSSVISFIKDNEDLVRSMISRESMDDDVDAAVLKVSPEVVSPTASMMREVLAETRQSFDVNTQDVFSDLKPEDFFN